MLIRIRSYTPNKLCLQNAEKITSRIDLSSKTTKKQYHDAWAVWVCVTANQDFFLTSLSCCGDMRGLEPSRPPASTASKVRLELIQKEWKCKKYQEKIARWLPKVLTSLGLEGAWPFGPTTSARTFGRICHIRGDPPLPHANDYMQGTEICTTDLHQARCFH